MRQTEDTERPTGVTALGILALIGGTLGLIAACAGLFNSGFLTALRATGTAQFVLIATGLAALVEAVIQLVFGIGALQLRPWAWTLGVVLQMANLLTAAVNLYEGASWASQLITFLISVPILLYLNTWWVRRAFGRS
jgi:hypothetical protein